MFFDNYKKICNIRGYTPSGCLRAMGQNANTASNWNKFGTIPKQETLEQLADFLECSVADFFQDGRKSINDTPPKQKTFELKTKSTNSLDVNQEGFMRVYSNCTDAQRMRLMAMVYDFEEQQCH